MMREVDNGRRVAGRVQFHLEDGRLKQAVGAGDFNRAGIARVAIGRYEAQRHRMGVVRHEFPRALAKALAAAMQ